MTSYVDPGLANNETYYYIVDALSGATDLGVSTQVFATPISGTPIAITLTGTVRYQDKEYGVNGFTGNQPYKAVRYAEVDIVPSTGPIIPTMTDSNGIYTISTAPSTTISMYVRVKSTATIPGAATIAIKSLSNALYGVGSNNFVPAGSASVNVDISTASFSGAFNVLDVFTNGFQFVYSLANAFPPSLSAYWQAGNPNGTYYCSGGGDCPGGEGIYVYNNPSGDTDEYDDDVLYHEFGHFIAAHFSQDDSPGGAHSLTDNDLDMRLSWSEGWGDAMPGNIKLWLSGTGQQNLLSSTNLTPLTEYIDTFGSGAGIAIDMDNPDGTYGIPSVYFSYACNEIAIAKILLDSNKTFGMQDVWNVIASYTLGDSPVSLETFWDRWNSKGYSSLQSIFNDRFIFYSDLYTSDTFSTATPLGLNSQQLHYIYPDGGFDLVSFTANVNKHYTISTSNLLNGADTYMTLLNSDGTTLTTNTTPANPNDNANGQTYSGVTVPSNIYPNILLDSYGIRHDNGFDILKSTLGFTATSTGTYYVKIQSSSTRPVSAGRYGTYTLRITSQ